MKLIEIELLTDQGNNAVVRLPERQHPGIVVQGDTLSTWIVAISDALESLDGRDDGDAQEVLRDLLSQLHDARERYESALREHGLELPY